MNIQLALALLISYVVGERIEHFFNTYNSALLPRLRELPVTLRQQLPPCVNQSSSGLLPVSAGKNGIQCLCSLSKMLSPFGPGCSQPPLLPRTHQIIHKYSQTQHSSQKWLGFMDIVLYVFYGSVCCGFAGPRGHTECSSRERAWQGVGEWRQGALTDDWGGIDREMAILP